MVNRWLINARQPARQWRSEVDRAFDDVFSELLGARGWWGVRPRSRRSFPAMNVWEDEANLYAEAEIPGLRMEDLELLIKGDELTLKCERKLGAERGVTYHRRERGTGAFSGVVHLPVEVDPEKAEAELEHGVLTIRVPKASAARTRKIEVKTRNS